MESQRMAEIGDVRRYYDKVRNYLNELEVTQKSPMGGNNSGVSLVYDGSQSLRFNTILTGGVS